ncbi:MAG: formate acetyltransferase, partial [Opitutales bacterium]|nr:formate acetyltransferase [Opitutales bacterium]
MPAWRGFKRGNWNERIDVADFIRLNHASYEGDESFLAPPTERTKRLWSKVLALMEKERQNNGLLDADVDTPSAVDSHGPGYIEKESELIVGLQTDAPLKRAIMPYGG